MFNDFTSIQMVRYVFFHIKNKQTLHKPPKTLHYFNILIKDKRDVPQF